MKNSINKIKLSISKKFILLYYSIRKSILTFYYRKTLSNYPQLNLQDSIIKFLEPYFNYKINKDSIILHISSPDAMHDYNEFPKATHKSVFKSQPINDSESIETTLSYLHFEKYVDKNSNYYILTPKSRELLETKGGFVKRHISSVINNFLLRFFWVIGILHIFGWISKLFNLIKPVS
jgi:hypothetical protein